MIRTPAQHNTENPPGTVTYPAKGRYLKDMIKRIQSDDGAMKLPTPIAGPSKALADLTAALLKLCDERETFSNYSRNITLEIRRIIRENT